MRKQDYLIQLIQSLNPNERRYFKLYSGLQQGEKKFMQLYDLLESKTEYNSAALCKEMNIPSGQLVKLKQYLTQELLRALRNQRDVGLIALHNARTDGRTLIERRQYEYALELTEKAIERAWEMEQFELLLSLLTNKYTCFFSLSHHDKMRALANTRQQVSLIISESAEMDFLDSEAEYLFEKKTSAKEFERLLQHPLLKATPAKLLSLRAKDRWYRINSYACQILMPGSKTLLNICKEHKAFYEKHPSLMLFNAYGYIKCVVTRAEAETSAENLSEALAIYEELEQVIDSGELKTSKERTDSIKAYIYIAYMGIYCKQGRFEKVLAQEKELKPLIAQRPVYEQIEAALILAIAYVHLQRSDIAVDKMNEMMEIDIPEMPLQLKTLRPLLIIAQVDIGNYQLIPYLVKSAKAWMKRNKYTDPEYDIFFSLISSIANPHKNTTRRKTYAELIQTIEEGKLKKLDSDIYLGKWVKRKITYANA